MLRGGDTETRKPKYRLNLAQYIPREVRQGVANWQDRYFGQKEQARAGQSQGTWSVLKPSMILSHKMQVLDRSGPQVTIEKNKALTMVERMPISWIVKARMHDNDVSQVRLREGPEEWTTKALEQTSISEASYRIGQRVYGQVQERNYGLAATTPVLGQYAPTFGWPDDWGWYWEYLDAYLFVPEAAYAVKLKTRQVWKPGFEFDGPSGLVEKVEKEWNRLKLTSSLKWGCKNSLTWGNTYLLSQDDSDAQFAEGTPADYAQGASFSNITGAPRPLVKFTEAKNFYGLMNTDPRTFRIQIHPQRWDDVRHQVLVEKYIQRRWAGPLAPTYALGSGTELDFHPEQCLHLAFNKITGGIYGYSTFREVLFTLKGFLIMVQFLPSIVEKRADPLLHIRIGGEMSKAGIKETWLPKPEEFNAQVARLGARMPSEDIITDAMTVVDEVYKGRGAAERVEQYITTYKERIMLGLGIPLSVTTMAGGSEIKWGTLNFELMEDEIREYQETVENLVNEWVIPKILLNLKAQGQEVTFKFNEITSEDWRADVAPLIQLYQSGIIDASYARRRLNIAEGEMGDEWIPIPKPGQANKVASQPRSQGGIPLSKKTKQAPQPYEKKGWHVKMNEDETLDITENS